MVEGNSLITFGYGTTFMIGSGGTFNDEPAVALYFRSREPGPVRDSEIKEGTEQHEIDISKYNATMVFKTTESIDSLIKLLTGAREALEEFLKEKKDE